MHFFLKNIIKFINKNLISCLILFIPILYAYYDLWNTFFVADAWNMLNSHTLYESFGLSYFFQVFAMPYGVHMVPLGVLFSAFQGHFFGVNAFGYGVLSLVLHFLNSFIIYYSVKKYTKNTFIGLLAGIFFGVNFQIREGVFWFASNTWTELNATLVMLGLFYLVKYYLYRKTKYIIIPYLAFFSSLFFREYTFMLLVISILFYLFMVFKDRINLRKYFLIIGVHIITIIFFFILRLFFVYSQNPLVLSSGQLFSKQTLITMIVNLFSLPASILGNILVPEKMVLFVTHAISTYVYSDLAIAQTPVFQTVLFFNQIYIFLGLITLFVCTLMITALKSKSKSIITPIYLYAIVFVLMPIVFLSLSGYLYWIFSRYLYLPAAIFSIFIFTLFFNIKILQRKNIITVLLLSLLVIYMSINAYLSHNFFSDFAKIGKLRESTLFQVSRNLNFENKYQLIFVKDNTSNYKNPAVILDYGSNTGKVILVWNWFEGNRNNIPQCLLDPLFLFKKTDEYRFCQNKGYGYFQDIDLLQKTILKNSIDKKFVNAYSYNAVTNEVKDISGEIWKRLK